MRVGSPFLFQNVLKYRVSQTSSGPVARLTCCTLPLCTHIVRGEMKELVLVKRPKANADLCISIDRETTKNLDCHVNQAGYWYVDTPLSAIAMERHIPSQGFHTMHADTLFDTTPVARP